VSAVRVHASIVERIRGVVMMTGWTSDAAAAVAVRPSLRAGADHRCSRRRAAR